MRFGWMAGVVASALAASAAVAQGPAIAGQYGELLLGFDPAGQRITGFFSKSTGAGKFSCVFFFSGTLANGRAPVTSWYPTMPGRIPGVVTVTGGHATVRLKEDHGGCWNVQHFADAAEPATFDRSAPHAWRAVGVVKSAKAYLHAAPNAASRGRAYLVEGDGVGLPGGAAPAGWVRVDYVSTEHPISGWLKAGDLYPLR